MHYSKKDLTLMAKLNGHQFEAFGATPEEKDIIEQLDARGNIKKKIRGSGVDLPKFREERCVKYVEIGVNGLILNEMKPYVNRSIRENPGIMPPPGMEERDTKIRNLIKSWNSLANGGVSGKTRKSRASLSGLLSSGGGSKSGPVSTVY